MDWDYHGSTITIQKNGQFKVEGQEPMRWFQTLEQAQKDVDDSRAVDAKARHDNVALPVLDNNGHQHTITGINRSTGKALGVPNKTYGLFYPTEVVKALLQEKSTLSDRVIEIDKKLRPAGIPNSYGYGRVSVEDYDFRMAELQTAYESVGRVAEGITP